MKAPQKNRLVTLSRMWVNQPSKFQEYHKLHGQRVLAFPTDALGYCRVYFTEGNAISQDIARFALSPGWAGGLK